MVGIQAGAWQSLASLLAVGLKDKMLVSGDKQGWCQLPENLEEKKARIQEFWGQRGCWQIRWVVFVRSQASSSSGTGLGYNVGAGVPSGSTDVSPWVVLPFLWLQGQPQCLRKANWSQLGVWKLAGLGNGGSCYLCALYWLKSNCLLPVKPFWGLRIHPILCWYFPTRSPSALNMTHKKHKHTDKNSQGEQFKIDKLQIHQSICGLLSVS